MCGIAGFVGPNAAERVMEGLRALEYRGYDSAGIAVVHEGKIHYRRRVGHLRLLADLLILTPLPASSVAIGHVRWATSGEVSESNAHPHVHKHIAVVANGIIENSPTVPDTRLIAQLIAAQHAPLKVAVQAVADNLKGTWAFAAISAREPETIATATSGMTLFKQDDGLITSCAVSPASDKLVYPHWMLKEIYDQCAH